MLPMTKSTKYSWLLLVAVAAVVMFFCYITPWLADDISYSFSFVRDNNDQWKWITSFHDVIISQNAHWFKVNGRYVAHFFVQCFCGMWGQTAFAVTNGLMYILFFLILAKFCRVKLDNFKGFASLVVVSLLTFQTKMVPSCQIGYIWTFTASLAFIYIFFHKDFLPNRWATLPLAIFSIIVGNGQEALNIGIGGALIIYWACNMRNMTLRQYILMICFGLGALALCLSPGVLHRAGATGSTNIIMRFSESIFGLIIYSRSLYLLIVVVAYRCLKCRTSLREIYLTNSFLWNVWGILLVFNILVVVMCNRQIFGEELMAIILSFRLLKGNTLSKRWLALFTIILIGILAIQGHCCLLVKKQMDIIKNEYPNSLDGRVFLDLSLPYSKLIAPSTKYFKSLMYSNVSDPDVEYINLTLGQLLQHKYKLNKKHLIVNIRLKGKRNQNLSNQIYDVGEGQYLIIQNKRHPQTPVLRTYSRYGLNPDTTVDEIDMTELLIDEGPYWRARHYQIGALSIRPSKQDVRFKTSK